MGPPIESRPGIAPAHPSQRQANGALETQESCVDGYPTLGNDSDQVVVKGLKAMEKSESRGRHNSLRHVKNSTEVLRQRSIKKVAKESALDAKTGMREGRQFTVANVGNNGKIYLRLVLAPSASVIMGGGEPRVRARWLTFLLHARPTVRPSMPTSPASPFVFPSAAPSDGARPKVRANRSTHDQLGDGNWSDTQKRGTPTRRDRVQSTVQRTELSPSPSRRSVSIKGGRTPSSSTMTAEARNPSRPGEFKIVIDHPHPVSKQLEKVTLPTIEVPIPHYRLGTPRFSARGTAFLHSSVYTRNSTNDDSRSSVLSTPEYERLFPGGSGADPNGVTPRRHSHASPPRFSVRIAPINEANRNSNAIVTSSPAFHRSKEPIVPAIFNAMARNPDDPAIVRYAPNTKEIIAASPARIIAQITSKNFLDYELLSDFFLTVRAYLPTHDLLAYLLARFEWAINRFDDDGRVIRVRAFAALRHWILNYFPYDFVIDRDLRVKFCDHLNALSRTVRERSVHGPSDLKLILDLKKCWNGRCALYWDHQSVDNDGRHDLDINPGGVAGSRDSQLTHPSQLWTRTVDGIPPKPQSTVDPKESASALNSWFDAVLEAEDHRTKGHERQASVVTSRSLPTSPISEQSIPAMSCTLPGKGLKKLMAQSQRSAGVHPVPVSAAGRRICPAAPSALANEKPAPLRHAHKRSGSFSDAVRDKRASLPSMGVPPAEEPIMMAFPCSGSLIRGSVVPPASPYFDAFAPNLSVSDLRSSSSFESDSDGPESSKHSSPLSPGVKNLLGSIRRALSSKQVSGHQSPSMAWSAAAPSSKSSTVPLNAPHAAEIPVERRRVEVLQKHSRVDLLCAEAAEVYHRAVKELSEEEPRPPSPTALVPGDEHQDPALEAQRLEIPPARTPARKNSEITNGSRSIFVFDDTENYPPVPNLPSNNDILAVEDRIREAKRSSTAEVPWMASPIGPIPDTQDALESRYDGAVRSDGHPELKSAGPFVAPALHESVGDPSAQADSNPASGISRVLSSHRPAPSALGRGRSYRSTYSGSTPLRRYASYQSGMARNTQDNNADAATAAALVPGSITATSEKPPGRMLRRRPGGDLRANQSVQDLEPIPRPRSTGSITTYTDSMRGSEFDKAKKIPTSGSARGPHSMYPGSIVPTSGKPLSLVRTHSSQPALRPSFEAAVAEFARIPDDEGGDIEATLLKLEGRYRKSPPTGSSTTVLHGHKGAVVASALPQPEADDFSSAAKHGHQPETARENISANPTIKEPDPPKINNDDNTTPKGLLSQSPHYNMASSLYAESEESYDSTPLLERRPSGEPSARDKPSPDGSKVSIPRPLFSPSQSQADTEPNLLAPTTDIGMETESQRRTRYRSSIPTTTDSFLLDEDEFLSDLSSELSMEMVDREDATQNVFGSSAQLLRDGVTPSNSGNVAGSSVHPPTPPMTKENAIAIRSQADWIQEQRKPPTPNPSPVNRGTEPAMGLISDVTKAPTSQPLIAPLNKSPTLQHLPFVLMFDSGTIAEQFTIIEKDALNEINWQDLINMRWHHTSPSTLNWVDYLRTQEPTGIELVTARFNIMVKWVLSEIVLTQSVEERASCVIKYIHVAKHCRRTHNYATLLQLTIALTSIDCSRLSKTWDLVPSAEKRTLQELETLVTPIKNFNNLRQEMETANADEGCIPVVGKSPHLLPSAPPFDLISHSLFYSHSLPLTSSPFFLFQHSTSTT